jgi:DNA-binding NtrC family response regulator
LKEIGMTEQWAVMVVSSDLENRRALARMLVGLGFDPVSAATVKQCREVLDKQQIALIFCERHFADGNYQDILKATICGSQKKNPRVILMSSLMKPEEYQQARQSGLFDIIGLPCRPTNVEWAIILAKRDERNLAKQLVAIPPANQARRISATAGVS